MERYRFVCAVPEPVCGKRRAVELPSGGVHAPVFGDADALVESPLRGQVLPSLTRGRQFQGEVGGLPNRPDQVGTVAFIPGPGTPLAK